jgi:putative hydrolase of the HAD superfamily
MINRQIIENHISLDFWGTLVFSNDNYRKARSFFLANELDKNPNEISYSFKKIGEKYNNFQEKGLNNSTPIELFKEVVEDLNIEENSIDINRLFIKVLDIFIENSPIINTELKSIIDSNLQNGKTVSILSNTAFIPGKVISSYLDHNFGVNYFSFKLFSDEVKIAKPNLEIYKISFDKINLMYPSGLEKNQILHIGDNYKNDILGAQKFGYNSYLI